MVIHDIVHVVVMNEDHCIQVMALASLAQVLVRVQLAHSVQIEMKCDLCDLHETSIASSANEAVLLTKPHVSVEN